ncbi:MAG: DUF4918 family protein [Candidatus Kapabacteria bacterium]|nr:DUF4918 family protein [Candidatus Kapabacteria bacterium]
MTFGNRFYSFCTSLQFNGSLPRGIHILNPYVHVEVRSCVQQFCNRYYADNTPRLSIWGINPGRLGGGCTGLSFTDPVILREECGINNTLGEHRELSATYVWSVIKDFGGAEAFFRNFFLTALCPLGLVRQAQHGAFLNCNFYDSPRLFNATKNFIIASLQQQQHLGLRHDVAVCLGSGKLHTIFTKLNHEHKFFQRILALEHPRFIMQYRRQHLAKYRQNYVDTLRMLV